MHYVYFVLAICYFMFTYLKYQEHPSMTDNYVIINFIAALAYLYATYIHWH